MSLRLRVAKDAESELGAAAAWYESKRAGLGVEFVAELDGTFDQLLEQPDRFPVWRVGLPFRRAVLRRFPFVVFFTADREFVEVWAVAHAKRRPGYWVGRLQPD